jgi:hypothetical protein
MEAIQYSMMEQVMAVPKAEFKMHFQHWQEQWNKCVCAEGAQLKGINLPFL